MSLSSKLTLTKFRKPIEINFDPHTKKNINIVAVVGSQFGDEGKGKLIGVLSPYFDICCRYNGGCNAGHSLEFKGKLYSMHILPSGMITDHMINVIGNGLVVHIESLMNEIEKLSNHKPNCIESLLISSRAHIVFDYHILADRSREKSHHGTNNFIGTTQKGIGPSYTTKINRTGIRFADLVGDWDVFEKKYLFLYNQVNKIYGITMDTETELNNHKKYAEILRNIVIDTSVWLNSQIISGKKVLIEGANATLLDIDFGTYPYVTSSSTVAGGICTGLGIPPFYLNNIVGVIKAYTTRVGEGPFPTELNNQIGETLRIKGLEYGTTTGRPRRCGWFDIPLVKYSVIINGIQSLFLSKLDILSGLEEIKICTYYQDKKTKKKIENGTIPVTNEEFNQIECVYETLQGWQEDICQINEFHSLPKNAQIFVDKLINLLECPIALIGVGPMHSQIIECN